MWEQFIRILAVSGFGVAVGLSGYFYGRSSASSTQEGKTKPTPTPTPDPRKYTDQELDEKFKEVGNKLDVALARISQLEKDLAIANQTIELLKIEKADLEKQLFDKNKEIKQLQNDKVEASQLLESENREVLRLGREIEDLKTDVENLQTKNLKQIESLNLNGVTISGLNNQIKEISDANKRLGKEIDEKEKQLKNSTNLLTAKQIEIEELTEKVNKKTQELAKTEKDLKDQLAKNELELAEVRKNTAHSSHPGQKSTAKPPEIDEKIANQKDREWVNAIAQKESEVKRLRDELAQIKVQKELLSEEKDRLEKNKKQHEGLEEQASNYRKEMKLLEETKDQQLAIAQQNIVANEEKLKQQIEEKQKLVTQLQAVSKNLAEEEAKRKELEKIKEQLSADNSRSLSEEELQRRRDQKSEVGSENNDKAAPKKEQLTSLAKDKDKTIASPATQITDYASLDLGISLNEISAWEEVVWVLETCLNKRLPQDVILKIMNEVKQAKPDLVKEAYLTLRTDIHILPTVAQETLSHSEHYLEIDLATPIKKKTLKLETPKRTIAHGKNTKSQLNLTGAALKDPLKFIQGLKVELEKINNASSKQVELLEKDNNQKSKLKLKEYCRELVGEAKKNNGEVEDAIFTSINSFLLGASRCSCAIKLSKKFHQELPDQVIPIYISCAENLLNHCVLYLKKGLSITDKKLGKLQSGYFELVAFYLDNLDVLLSDWTQHMASSTNVEQNECIRKFKIQRALIFISHQLSSPQQELSEAQLPNAIKHLLIKSEEENAEEVAISESRATKNPSNLPNKLWGNYDLAKLTLPILLNLLKNEQDLDLELSKDLIDMEIFKTLKKLLKQYPAQVQIVYEYLAKEDLSDQDDMTSESLAGLKNALAQQEFQANFKKISASDENSLLQQKIKFLESTYQDNPGRIPDADPTIRLELILATANLNLFIYLLNKNYYLERWLGAGTEAHEQKMVLLECLEKGNVFAKKICCVLYYNKKFWHNFSDEEKNIILGILRPSLYGVREKLIEVTTSVTIKSDNSTTASIDWSELFALAAGAPELLEALKQAQATNSNKLPPVDLLRKILAKGAGNDNIGPLVSSPGQDPLMEVPPPPPPPPPAFDFAPPIFIVGKKKPADNEKDVNSSEEGKKSDAANQSASVTLEDVQNALKQPRFFKIPAPKSSFKISEFLGPVKLKELQEGVLKATTEFKTVDFVKILTDFIDTALSTKDFLSLNKPQDKTLIIKFLQEQYQVYKDKNQNYSKLLETVDQEKLFEILSSHFMRHYYIKFLIDFMGKQSYKFQVLKKESLLIKAKNDYDLNDLEIRKIYLLSEFIKKIINDQEFLKLDDKKFLQSKGYEGDLKKVMISFIQEKFLSFKNENPLAEISEDIFLETFSIAIEENGKKVEKDNIKGILLVGFLEAFKEKKNPKKSLKEATPAKPRVIQKPPQIEVPWLTASLDKLIDEILCDWFKKKDFKIILLEPIRNMRNLVEENDQDDAQVLQGKLKLKKLLKCQDSKRELEICSELMEAKNKYEEEQKLKSNNSSKREENPPTESLPSKQETNSQTSDQAKATETPKKPIDLQEGDAFQAVSNQNNQSASNSSSKQEVSSPTKQTTSISASPESSISKPGTQLTLEASRQKMSPDAFKKALQEKSWLNENISKEIAGKIEQAKNGEFLQFLSTLEQEGFPKSFAQLGAAITLDKKKQQLQKKVSIQNKDVAGIKLEYEKVISEKIAILGPFFKGTNILNLFEQLSQAYHKAKAKEQLEGLKTSLVLSTAICQKLDDVFKNLLPGYEQLFVDLVRDISSSINAKATKNDKAVSPFWSSISKEDFKAVYKALLAACFAEMHSMQAKKLADELVKLQDSSQEVVASPQNK